MGSESSRIAALDIGIKEALVNGKLYKYINKLISNIIAENRLWTRQYQVDAPAYEWYELISSNFHLKLDGIEYIKNRLLSSYGFSFERTEELISTSRNTNKSYWSD